MLELLASRGVNAEMLSTLPGGRTIGAVRDALDAGTFDVVIAMGGDGTFREVASALLASRAPERTALGMMPTGTANDQGKSFGLEASPHALERNVDVICAANEARLDAGVLRAGGATDHFFDSAGWGLSARVLARRNQDRRFVEALGPLKELYRDHAVYAGALLKTFLESYVINDKFSVTGTLDGVPFELDGITDLVVKNTRIYGGAWVFDKTSEPDDGAFELVPFRGKRDWTSKAIVDLDGNPLTEAILNEIGVEHSKPVRASVMEIEIQEPAGGALLAAQLDGEEWPAHGSVRIEVIPRAIRLIVP